jgi:hypothetical protein
VTITISQHLVFLLKLLNLHSVLVEGLLCIVLVSPQVLYHLGEGHLITLVGRNHQLSLLSLLNELLILKSEPLHSVLQLSDLREQLLLLLVQGLHHKGLLLQLLLQLLSPLVVHWWGGGLLGRPHH